jgi:hypothetical protein
MITANNVRYMIDIPLEHMKACAISNKIKGLNMTGVEFLGMTNGGEFCYSIFQEDDGVVGTKLFLRYDPTADRVTATIG